MVRSIFSAWVIRKLTMNADPLDATRARLIIAEETVQYLQIAPHQQQTNITIFIIKFSCTTSVMRPAWLVKQD